MDVIVFPKDGLVGKFSAGIAGPTAVGAGPGQRLARIVVRSTVRQESMPMQDGVDIWLELFPVHP